MHIKQDMCIQTKYIMPMFLHVYHKIVGMLNKGLFTNYVSKRGGGGWQNGKDG